ncbi:hypothetical protein HK100_004049 [Physocladia obscura]|uniref:separase n=1 Tax=Physocladia obscura TaxID=109957 RepID=A0AAD5XD82_9FUNG|nr:hypothetical protein HK100_004049 [Physocladia obscura]
MNSYLNPAFSIPWCVPSKSQFPANKAGRKPQSASLEKNVSQLEELLIEAFQCAKAFGASQTLYNLCNKFALVNFIRAYLTGGINESTAKNISLATAFYLDQSKGVTSKRELLTILDDKKKAPSDPKFAYYSNETRWSPVDLSSEIINRLPRSWVVVSLSVEPALDDLYVSRISNGHSPVVFRLPMKRQAIREGEDDGFGLETILTEFADIISSSDRSSKVAAEMALANREQTRDDKISWWNNRYELDTRLRDLLLQIEKYWIGGFKGLLIQDDFLDHCYEAALFEFKTTVEHLTVKAVAGKARIKPLPLDCDLCCMILRLGSEPDPIDVEDLLYYLMDAYQYAGCPIGYDELNIDMMENSLSTAITKFHITRMRILASMQQHEEDRPHLILVLDKKLQCLPWESLPCLRGVSISRIPSLSFLHDKLSARREISKRNATYVLNPSKDLINTENEFRTPLSRFDFHLINTFITSENLGRNITWCGIVGRKPTEEEFESGLASSSLFFYFGHGGAEQYVRGHKIRKMDNCPVSFLMGCSSGKLSAPGEFDIAGTALNYLMGGSPAVVGNLWDVTDKDIDRFSRKMLTDLELLNETDFDNERKKRATAFEVDDNEMERQFFRLEQNQKSAMSLSEAVAAARESCDMKFIVGAAPVVYGIPIFFINFHDFSK